MGRGGTVLLLRDPDEDEGYTALLHARLGFDAVCVSVLETEYGGDNDPTISLAPTLKRVRDTFRGVVISSQRAATALAKGMSALSPTERDCQLTGFPVFGVGSRCLSPLMDGAARAAGLQLLGVGTGNADALADCIIAWDAAASSAAASASSADALPLLFLCGDKRLPVLPTRLAAAGIAVTERVVYRTRERPAAALEDALVAALRAARRHSPLVIVFFSPSGLPAFIAAEGVADALRRAQERQRQHAWEQPPGVDTDGDDDGFDALLARHPVRLIAFGHTTRAAMQCAGFEVAGVCATPDPTGLVAALEGVLAAQE